MSIKGVQTTTEANSHDALSKCDVRNYSHGREVVKFATPKPIKVTLAKVPGQKELVAVYGTGKATAPTTAKVTRSYTTDITPPPESCGGNGGGGEPEIPDCGTRTYKPWKMNLVFHKGERVGLEADYVSKQLFKVCPGGTFPELLAENTVHTPITTKLPSSEVFDEGIGKLIVIGRGKREYVLHDYDETAKVRWEVSLKRS